MKKGKVIAAFGIPGSGKSTTTKAIGDILGISTFHEPEEEEWGQAVKSREIVGNFNAIMWFRANRIPQYYKAEKLRNQGKHCMMDSCYDKLFYLYYNREGLHWLFTKDDNYYDEMIEISRKDYTYIPDIDIIVFFKQSESNWRKFLEIRNRNLDNETEFKNSFILQSAFIDAVKIYSQEKNCRLLIHNQKFSSPRAEAEIIVKKLTRML